MACNGMSVAVLRKSENTLHQANVELPINYCVEYLDEEMLLFNGNSIIFLNDGLYMINGQVWFGGTNNNNYTGLNIYINGQRRFRNITCNFGNETTTSIATGTNLTDILSVNVGDTLSVTSQTSFEACLFAQNTNLNIIKLG